MDPKLFDLSGRVVIITGAAGLLGRQHAEAIASSGGTPILLDLKLEPVEHLAYELNKLYEVNSSGYAVDVTCETEIEVNSQKLLDQYGKIDALVNNAANNPKVENQEGEIFFGSLERRCGCRAHRSLPLLQVLRNCYFSKPKRRRDP